MGCRHMEDSNGVWFSHSTLIPLTSDISFLFKVANFLDIKVLLDVACGEIAEELKKCKRSGSLL